MEEKYLTIEAINKYLEYKFKIDDNLKDILVLAEISTLSITSTGHYYLTIKDGNYKMRAILFKNRTYNNDFKLKVGDKVIINGSISLYPNYGDYSLIIDKITLAGEGAIKLRLEKLKKELQAKGYFNIERKKPIPKYPKNIAIVTSPTGAVVKDIINTIKRRCSNINVYIYPTLVQGSEAHKYIAAQINRANKDNLVDVIIIGRGGGAVEELAAFNERVVCDAIYYSKIPVISAVGHDRDSSLSDLVSDLSVSTPTAAGEKVTEEYIKIIDKVNYNLNKVNTIINNKVANYNKELDTCIKILNLSDPRLKVYNHKVDINRLLDKLNKDIIISIDNSKDNIFDVLESINLNINNKINNYNSQLNLNDMLLEKHNPINNIKKENILLDNKINYINNIINNKLELKNAEFSNLISRVSTNNPAKLLEKGYSMTKVGNNYISSVKDVDVNETILVSLKDGTLKAEVKEIKNGRY